ncbi:MAG: hypothetical protein ABJA34_14515, partial [Pseudonocardiales bacterium]
ATAPAVVLMEGTGTTAAAGHGQAVPSAGFAEANPTEHLKVAEHEALAAPTRRAAQDPARAWPVTAQAPLASAAVGRPAPRSRPPRAPVIAVVAAVVLVATAGVVYAATRPSHSGKGAPAAVASSTPRGTLSLSTSVAAGAGFTYSPTSGPVGTVISINGNCRGSTSGDAVALYRVSDGAFGGAKVQLGNTAAGHVEPWVTTLEVATQSTTVSGATTPTTLGAYEIRLFCAIGSSFRVPGNSGGSGSTSAPAADAIQPFTVS